MLYASKIICSCLHVLLFSLDFINININSNNTLHIHNCIRSYGVHFICVTYYIPLATCATLSRENNKRRVSIVQTCYWCCGPNKPKYKINLSKLSLDATISNQKLRSCSFQCKFHTLSWNVRQSNGIKLMCKEISSKSHFACEKHQSEFSLCSHYTNRIRSLLLLLEKLNAQKRNSKQIIVCHHKSSKSYWKGKKVYWSQKK